MLVFETVNDQNWSANTSAFQIVIGVDGAGSLTRQFVFGMSDMVTHGEDTALDIAFKVPKIECNHHKGLPFEQNVNCALSIAQRRYLLNARRINVTGYLNVQLSNDEMKHALTLEDTQPCTWTNPAYLNISDTHGKTFKPYADYMNNLGSEESRRLWSVCLDGLKLFGLTEEHLTNVVGIRLAVRYAKKVCKVYFKYFFFYQSCHKSVL